MAFQPSSQMFGMNVNVQSNVDPNQVAYLADQAARYAQGNPGNPQAQQQALYWAGQLAQIQQAHLQAQQALMQQMQQQQPQPGAAPPSTAPASVPSVPTGAFGSTGGHSAH